MARKNIVVCDKCGKPIDVLNGFKLKGSIFAPDGESVLFESDGEMDICYRCFLNALPADCEIFDLIEPQIRKNR